MLCFSHILRFFASNLCRVIYLSHFSNLELYSGITHQLLKKMIPSSKQMI